MPDSMGHTEFDFHLDFSQPLFNFLTDIGFLDFEILEKNSFMTKENLFNILNEDLFMN